MDSIQEEFGVVNEHGEQSFVLGRPISPRLDRQRSYSYGSERSLSTGAGASHHDGQGELSHIPSCTLVPNSHVCREFHRRDPL
jgi:hypothetical protein